MAKKLNNDINAQIFFALKVSEKSRVPFLFMSAPGMGKTTSVEMFAKITGYQMEVLRGNSTSENEVMGYDVVDTTPGAKGTIHLRPSWFTKVLQNEKDGKKSLLFLDEITTCPEHVQSALLHLIFERKVGDEAIPKDTLIVSAGNYSQSLGNTFGLIPPLMNRFCIFNIVPEIDDLKSFLSRYEGALTDTMEDFFEVRKKQFAGLTSKETSFDDVQLNRICERIETGVYGTTHMLATAGERKIDLKVTEMQNIYSDTDNDATLKGFVSMRTLNYLRDCTIAVFTSFGKEGVQSKNFYKIVEGLVGIGLTRDKNGSIKSNLLTDEYVTQLQMVITDIEKMKNLKIPQYEEFFTKILSKSSLNIEEINVINNKIQELKTDKDIKGISRPIEVSQVEGLYDRIVKSAEGTCKIKMLQNDKASNQFKSPEEAVGMITNWNTCIETINTLSSLVSDPDREYPDIIWTKAKTSCSVLEKTIFKIDSLSKLLIDEDPMYSTLLPQPKKPVKITK